MTKCRFVVLKRWPPSLFWILGVNNDGTLPIRCFKYMASIFVVVFWCQPITELQQKLRSFYAWCASRRSQRTMASALFAEIVRFCRLQLHQREVSRLQLRLPFKHLYLHSDFCHGRMDHTLAPGALQMTAVSRAFHSANECLPQVQLCEAGPRPAQLLHL